MRSTLFAALALCALAPPILADWRTVETVNEPTARHECGFVEAGGKLYLIGGRGEKPVEIYDPETRKWSRGELPPLEIHHFQPAVFDEKIYILGAFTGRFPRETPVPDILIYDPAEDAWSEGPSIPEDRRRGAAGVVVHDGKIYLVCGIVDGHYADFVPWLDEFDPETEQWRQLPDAPRPRDHFQAAVLDGKLYAAGGRTSSQKTQQGLELTIPEADVFDFEDGVWTTLEARLPTERAGASTAVFNGKIIILGGESGAQVSAHPEVEAFDPETSAWTALPPLRQGRHGTVAVIFDGKLWTAAGSGNRGGGPELTSLEVFETATP